MVLASADLGALDADMTEAIRDRIFRSCSIPRENICLNVTHTHGAPAVVSIPTWQPGVSTADAAFLCLVENQISRAIEEAYRSAVPADVRFARGETHIGYDRHFDPPAIHDETLDVLFATGPDGHAIATAAFVACHPICLGAFNQVSADFAGAFRSKVEQRFGGVTLFFQGYGGIANPRGTDLEAVGAALADDVAAAIDGPTTLLYGTVRARLTQVNLPFQPLPFKAILREARAAGGVFTRWNDSVASIGDDAPDTLPTPLQALSLGAGPDGWTLAASGHEVTADFAPTIRAIRPNDHVTVMGFSNSQRSYIPSRRVLELPASEILFPFNPNYEGGQAFAWYGHRAPLTTDVDERFVRAHAELLNLL